MGKLIGIDLGTTNSCVALMQDDDAFVIPNSEGSRTTPSMVSFTDKDERLVGQLAKRAHVANAEHTVYAIKRLIGHKFEDAEIQKIVENSPFEIIKGKNGDAWVKIRGKEFSAVEISSIVLGNMKKVAEDYLGEEVTEAVITVPAYFDDTQRQATRDAGRIAGLDVKRIINEPTAAALAYGMKKVDADEIIAVYDLGGGTFDISILELSTGMFQVRATNGDTFLGGEDFDIRLVEFLMKKFKEDVGIDLKTDDMALQRVKEAAEKAKMELSGVDETDINLPFLAVNESGPQHLVASITRAEFEDLTRDLVEKTLKPCQAALDDAGITVDEIDHILMVGGQTRMPLVQKLVSDFFKTKPFQGINPDEVVAMGASIQGGILDGEVEDILLLDVVPLSIGVETAGGIFTKVILKNTPIPTRKSMTFTTAVDNQPFVNIKVCQGEREMVEDNKDLANFQLMGIPPAPRGVPQIEVTFEVDANGILSVVAKDLGTQREQKINVTPNYGLSEEDIEKIKTDSEVFANEDREKRVQAELKNKAETLIYTTERAIEEYEDILNEEEVSEIKEDLNWCKSKLSGNNLEMLKDAVMRLETSAHLFSEILYKDFMDDSE
jgi:molecular chaperone DnaK